MMFKSRVAVIVENVLEQQNKTGLFNVPASAVANKLVQKAWDSKPDLFNGGFGQRPDKISVAAYALAIGASIESMERSGRTAMLLSLGVILQDYAVNGKLRPLNSIDDLLMGWTIEAYEKAAGELGLLDDEFYAPQS